MAGEGRLEVRVANGHGGQAKPFAARYMWQVADRYKRQASTQQAAPQCALATQENIRPAVCHQEGNKKEVNQRRMEGEGMSAVWQCGVQVQKWWCVGVGVGVRWKVCVCGPNCYGVVCGEGVWCEV